MNIAHQCPAAGGQSVYRARTMLALINDSIEYNDAIVCLQSGVYREFIKETITHKFEIIPNPAQDLIEIVLSDKLEGLCTFKIINTFGQTINQRKIDCSLKSHIIDISSIVQGAYIIKLEFSNLTYDNQKLIIVR